MVLTDVYFDKYQYYGHTKEERHDH